jgi:sugar O-acyltransferase (sialic acid O-acetyltransferase NeuD family)
LDHLIGIYGASGFGSEVMPLVKAQAADYKVLYVDDNTGFGLSGQESIPYESFLELEGKTKAIVVAISDSNIRQKLFEKCAKDGVLARSVWSSTARKYDNVYIGEGHIICDYVVLTSNIEIGLGFHANIYSYVAHDCKIGNFVTFAPGVKCNGNVEISDNVYVGTGAIIKQGTNANRLRIGKGAVIGMGAVVTKDVPPEVTVVGNPARPLE